MKRNLSVFMSIVLCITLLPVPDMAAKTTLSVTKSLELTVGQSKTIKVKGSHIKSKKYKTSSKKIATVSKKGKVTGKGSGKCKITVTVKYKKSKKAKKYLSKKFTCNIKVKTQMPEKTAVSTNLPASAETPRQTPVNTVAPIGTPNVTEAPTQIPEKTMAQTDTPAVTEEPTEAPTQTPEETVAPTETPASTEAPTQTPGATVTPTNTPLTSAVPQKNEEDVEALTRLIDEQRALGAKVSTDVESTKEYIWEKLSETDTELRLVEIQWQGKGLVEAVSFEGLTALKKLQCDDNDIVTLDVSKNTALTYVRCDEGVEVTGYSRVVHHPGE